MSRLGTYLKKDGWLIAAVLICAALCVALGMRGEHSADDDISRVLSAISGAGEVNVAVYYDEAIPCGAVVVAEGADDVAVRLALTQAVITLLGVEPSRVAVYPRSGGE